MVSCHYDGLILQQDVTQNGIAKGKSMPIPSQLRQYLNGPQAQHISRRQQQEM